MRADDVDPARFMVALRRARVRWLLIGRQALVHYGVPAQTMDYDLWIDPAQANVRKVLEVAHDTGFESASLEEVRAKPMFVLFGGTLKIDVFKVRVFKNLDGETIDFQSAYRRKVIASAEGDALALPLPSLRDLRTLKRMRDGAKDREDLRSIDLLLRRSRGLRASASSLAPRVRRGSPVRRRDG